MERKRPPSFGRTIGQIFVVIKIGPIASDEYHIHKDLLYHHSSYFKAALESEFIEAKEKTLPVIDVTPKVFAALLDRMYFERLFDYRDEMCTFGTEPCLNCVGSPCTDVDEANGSCEFQALSKKEEEHLEKAIATEEDPSVMPVHLYVFVDRFDMPKLREAIVEQLWRRMKSTSDNHRSYAEIIFARRHLPTSAPLNRLLFDAFIKGWASDVDHGCLTETKLRQALPPEFMFMAMARFRQAWRAGQDETDQIKELCAYHEHSQDKETIRACQERLQEARVHHKSMFEDDKKIADEVE